MTAWTEPDPAPERSWTYAAVRAAGGFVAYGTLRDAQRKAREKRPDEQTEAAS